MTVNVTCRTIYYVVTLALYILSTVSARHCDVEKNTNRAGLPCSFVRLKVLRLVLQAVVVKGD